MTKRNLIIGIVITILLGMSSSFAFAFSFTGVVEVYCAGFGATAGTQTFDRDNTGLGQEATSALILDGYGNVLFSDLSSTPLGTYVYPTFYPYTAAPQANPITFTFKSLAGNGLPEQLVFVVQGSCAGLPTVAPVTPAAVDHCSPLTTGAVVGDVPFAADAYYAPGKVAAGVTLNAGTYWVLGIDESSEYYKIRLACDYLWLPVSVVQPSYQPPWNGQALPTNVVS